MLVLAANAELAASSGTSLGSLLIDGSLRLLKAASVFFLRPKSAAEVARLGCACRKSNPAILVM
jgi:hypothetical protein